MKKILALVIVLLVTCGMASAQLPQTVIVPTPDPNNVTIAAFTPLSFFSSQPQYFMSIPTGMTSFSMSFVPQNGSASDGLNFRAACIASSTDVPFSLAAVPSSLIPFTYKSTFGNPTAVIYNPGAANIPIGPGVSTLITSFSVVGCYQIQMTLGSPTGTLTDLVKIAGTFSNSSMVPFGAGGPSETISMGVNSTGTITPISINSAFPGTPVATGMPPTDTFGNNVAVDLVTLGNHGPLNVFPLFFDGVAWERQFLCTNTSTFSVASTVTQVVPLSGTTKVRICSFSMNPSTATAGSVDIVYGTGANCVTGTTTLTGAYTLPASAIVSIGPVSLGNTGALFTPAGQAVCIRTTTSTVNGFITWEQH